MHMIFSAMKFQVAIAVIAAAFGAINVPDVAEFAALFDAVNTVDTVDTIASFDVADAMASKPVCEDIKRRELCPFPMCTYCSIIDLKNPTVIVEDGMEGKGCKDSNHAKDLQATGRYFCTLDPVGPFCNGRKENDCLKRPECSWCSHRSVGQACFSKKQAVLIPHKHICSGGSAANQVDTADEVAEE